MDAQEAYALVSREPKIAWLPTQPLSTALPYGSLMLVGSLLTIFLAYRLVDNWVLPWVYHSVYPKLTRDHRESFLGHHMSGFGLAIVIILACYPAMGILAIKDVTFRTPLFSGSPVDFGDAALFLTQVYGTLYIAELYARYTSLTWLLVAHHVGLLLISQTAIALSARLEEHPEATLEIYMCIVWATFDMVTEIPLHICLIIWRLWRTQYRILAPMCLLCAVWIVCMALFEMAITIYLLHMTWDRWEDWRIATPIVFSLWICTQLYGGWNFYQMSMGARRKARENAVARVADDVEMTVTSVASTPEARSPGPSSAAGKSADRTKILEIILGDESISSLKKASMQSRSHLANHPLSSASSSSSSSNTRRPDSMDHEQH